DTSGSAVEQRGEGPTREVNPPFAPGLGELLRAGDMRRTDGDGARRQGAEERVERIVVGAALLDGAPGDPERAALLQHETGQTVERVAVRRALVAGVREAPRAQRTCGIRL